MIAVISGIAAVVGYTAFGNVGPAGVAIVTAVAAGAILAMLADTMIPEAFEDAHALAGLVTVLGFLCAFALSKAHVRQRSRETSAAVELVPEADKRRESDRSARDDHERRLHLGDEGDRSRELGVETEAGLDAEAEVVLTADA